MAVAGTGAGISRLLDIDPDLAAGLPSELVERLRPHMVVATVTIPTGSWDPPGTHGDTAIRETLLVIGGLIVRDVVVAGVPTSEIIGEGDFIERHEPRDSMLPVTVRWTVASRATVALLDRRLVALLPTWPGLGARLLGRATGQTARQAVLCAISHLPRVELRLLALLWHLADRWGQVSPGGVVIPLALTHETLGRLVGARRPTVSLALKELAVSGDVTRRADGSWVLAPQSLRQLASDDEIEAAARAPAAPASPQPILDTPALRVAGAPAPNDVHDWGVLRARFEHLREMQSLQSARVTATLERCARTRTRVTNGLPTRERRAAP